MKNPTFRIIVAFTAMYLIWGSTFLAVRFGVATLPPFLMAGFRFIISGTVFWAISYRRRRHELTAGSWARAGVLGVLMIVIANGFVSWAEETVPSGLVAIMWALFPLLLAIVASLRPGGPRPGKMSIAGTAVGLVAMVFMLDPGRSPQVASNLSGLLIVVIAVLAWTAGTLVARDTSQAQPALLSVAMQMLVAGVILLAIAGIRGEFGELRPAEVSARSLVAFLYLTSVGSIVFPIYYWLLKVTTASKVATEAYVCPVIALILGTVVGGETITTWTAGWSAVVVVGVAMLVSDKSTETSGENCEAMEVETSVA